MQTEQRYTITAVIAWHDTEHRIPLGTATSRRKARRLGYCEGKYHYPLLSTSSVFSIDIVDEVTGDRVSTDWVEYEAYLRAQELETVGQRGTEWGFGDMVTAWTSCPPPSAADHLLRQINSEWSDIRRRALAARAEMERLQQKCARARTPTTHLGPADAGDHVMTYTAEQSRVYDALAIAAERIGRGNYAAQLAAHTKARRARSTFKFTVSDAHAAVVAAMPRVLSGAITPEEAMGLLHEHDVLTEKLRG